MSYPHYTPLLKIREMLMYFKLNLPSQSFIEESVPSLKKLLTYINKEDIIREANVMLEELFRKYDLDLEMDIFITEDDEKPTIYFLNIVITYDNLVHTEELTVVDSKLITNYDFYKDELITDREY